jgi:hypothetical protein
VSALYEVTISHARSAPLRNVFRYRSYLWLVDLDHLPRVRLLAGFHARDHLGDPRASIQADDRLPPAVRRLRRPDQRFHPAAAETGAGTECRSRSSGGKGLRKVCCASQPNSPPLA